MIDEKKELQTPKTVKKTRAINKRIIVRTIDDKPYYSIRYFNLDDCRWHVGYSSYKLEFVVEWLRTCFDIVDTKSGWIPVSERLPNEEEFKKDDGRFMLDDGNRRYQGFFDIHDGCFKFSAHISGLFPELVEDKDVIAWQPLPEPYQNDEQEE